MKNTILTICLILFTISLLQAQAPNLLPWQGAFRDKDDQAQNGLLDLRFRLLQGSATSSTIAFEEINNNVPLKLGVASHVLGSIDTAGFAAIDWSNGPYFLEVARFKGGSAPEVVGMPEQLKSLPYALYATNTSSWSRSGNNVFNSTSNIGLGTSTPANKLEIKSTSSQIRLSDNTGGIELFGGSNLHVIKDGTNLFNLYGGNVPLNQPRLHIEGLGHWDPSNTEGDLRIGNTTNRMRFGVAIGGGGAGNGFINASGNALHFGRGNNYYLLNLIGDKIGIRTTNPLYTLHVKQTAFNNGLALEGVDSGDTWSFATINNGSHDLNLFFNNGFRGYYYSGNGNYVSASDKRLKKEIQIVGTALQDIMKIEPVTYRFIHQTDDKRRSYGFLAQNVEKVFPELVHVCDAPGEINGTYSLDYTGMSVVAIKAIQEQQKIIESLTVRLDALERKLQALGQK